MTPSAQIDALAEAYYAKLHEGDCSPPYDELNAGRQEKHRRAVRALLLEQMRIAEESTDGLLAFVRPTDGLIPAEPEPRLLLIDRLKRRAG